MDEEHWHLVYTIVRTAATSSLRVPVTCKIRVFADNKKTIRFAKMLEEAGCSLLTVHGRQRDRALHHASANWSAIQAVREALRIPVIANGGVSSFETAEKCLEETGCVATMVATALLSNPDLFLPVQDTSPSRKAAKQCLRYLAHCEVHSPWSIRWPRDHLRAILASVCKAPGPQWTDCCAATEKPLEADSSEMQKTSSSLGYADILLALDLVGAKAGRSPPAIGAEEALAAYWRQICQEFRDVLRLLCTREGLCRDGDTTFEGLPWGSSAINGEKLKAVPGASSSPCTLGGGSKAAAALARQVPVSKRYMDRQQQKAAALKSCMMATSKWSRPEKQ